MNHQTIRWTSRVCMTLALTLGLGQAQDLLTIRNLATLGTGENEVLWMKYDPASRQVFILDDHGYNLWSLDDMSNLQNHRHETDVDDGEYDFSQQTVALARYNNWTVITRDQKTSKFQDSNVMPYNGLLYVGRDTLKMLSAPTSNGLTIGALPKWPRALNVSADGQQVLVTQADRALLYQVSPGKLLKTFGPIGYEDAVARFSPEDTQVLLHNGSNGGLFDVATGLRISDFAFPDEIKRASFSPDGNKLAFATREADVFLFDRSTGALLKTLKGHYAPLTTARFSPDGALLASADENGHILLWDASTGERLKSLKQAVSNHAVYDVAFTWDGKYLLTWGGDDLVKVWGVPGSAVFAKTAKLLLSSTVEGARAVIDREPMGEVAGAGKEITLAAGVVHHLTITAPNHKPYVTDLTLQAGEERSLMADPQKLQGKVTLQSTPSGALVLINGEALGKTPLTLNNLAAGDLTFSLKYAGYAEYKGIATVKENQPTNVQAVMKELPGLRVTSNPAGASVYLNGQQMGVTPLVLDGLKPGNYTLTFKLKGYKDQTVTGKVNDSGKTKVDVVMKK